MKSSRILLLVIMLGMAAACGGGGGGGGVFPIVPAKKPATLVSISVTPANPSISIGTSEQFTATGTYSDASTKNLTSSATWTSSDVSVATITTGGLVSSGSGTGTSLLSATSGTITGSVTLKVTSGGAVSGPNVMAVTVNGSLCNLATSSSYPNKPCVSVTLCTAGTSTCQTINDILLDTGSYGLRIFKSVLAIPLTQVAAGSGSLTECVQYGDLSTQWGPVLLADVILGGEPAVTVPIQAIDQGYAIPQPPCNGSQADTGPNQTPGAGFNGILGVGLFAADCGSTCTGNPLYFSCSGSSCIASTPSLTSQVQNPVSLLPVDNNGVILSLPSVSPTGAAKIDGSLILGIGTQHNNTPWSVTTYPANATADFRTVFNGQTYTLAFIDSGSNGLYFPSSITQCTGVLAGWYCPSSLQALIATNQGTSGSPSVAVSFTINSANTLFLSGNNVFDDLGANPQVSMFDWGLPFFLGRDIYVGIDGKHSQLSPPGDGPYWAY